MKFLALLEKVNIRKWSGNATGHESLRNASRIAAMLRNPDVGKITTVKLEEVCDMLHRGGLSGATINRHMSAVSYALTHAVRLGVIESKPMMPEMRKERARDRHLTEQEVREIALHLTDDDHLRLTYFLFDTGLRVSEALALTRDDLDIEAQVVTVRTLKGGNPRLVPLTQRALAHSVGAQTHRLFACSQDSYNWAFRRAREVSPLKGQVDVVPHTLRHSAASRLAAGGADVMLIKEFLGHKSMNTTMRYVHLNRGRLSAAAAILEIKS